MFEYGRLDQLFQIVRSSAFTPASKLSDVLGVTERTMRSDVSALNNGLDGYGAQVEIKRGAGYRLVISDAKRFESFLQSHDNEAAGLPDLSSPAERLRIVLSKLVMSVTPITTEALSDLVFVGDDTLQSYIRQARDVLQTYDIECIFRRDSGFRTYGREADRRRCIVNEVIDRDDPSYVTAFSAAEQMLFEGIDLEVLAQTVRECLSEASLSYSDYGLKNFMVHTALMVFRIKQDSYIEAAAPEIPVAGKALMDNLCRRLGQAFDLHIPSSERDYLYLHLANDTKFAIVDVDSTAVADSLDRMLDLICRYYGFDLRSDVSLRKGLNAHLVSMLQAKTATSSRVNPLLNTIRRSFPLAYEVTLICANEAFESSSLTFSEDEIGYMALHVGAAIERFAPANTNIQRALVICGSGRAALGMLETRVASLFSGRIEVVAATSFQGYLTFGSRDFDNIDFVITTIPLNDCPVPTILVDFRLSSQDVKSLSKFIEEFQGSDFFHIGRFFSPSSFSIYDEKVTKEELLLEMSNQLIDDDVATEGLYESCIERENVASTALSETLALPHPLKPCAKTTRVGVALLRKPIKWQPMDVKSMSVYEGVDYTGMRIQVVFLLLLNPQDSTDVTRFYDLLIKITEDPRLGREIANSASYTDFIRVIRSAC